LCASVFIRLGLFLRERKSVFKTLGDAIASKVRTCDKIASKTRTMVNCNEVLNVIIQAIHEMPCDEESVTSCNHITIYDEECIEEEDVEYAPAKLEEVMKATVDE
jgi:hypothetical protein